MIEDVIKYLNTKINDLGIVSKTFGLCELIGTEEKSPAEYCNGEFRSVADFDFFKGLAYHRLIGDVTATDIEEEEWTGCQAMKTYRFPMRAIVLLKRSGNYSDLLVGQTVNSTITFTNNKALRILLSADTVAVESKTIIVDKERLIDEEFSNQNIEIDYEDLFVGIEYDIIITGGAPCLEKYGCKRDYSEDYSNGYS
jgi:hypothetical protein